jgi:hypothetical protein
MSREHAKKEIVTGGDKSTSHGKAPSGESGNKMKGAPSYTKSHRSGDKKKKMKKVVYYETDSSSPSTSGSDTPSVTSKHHERKKFSKIPLRYPRISKHTPLLSVPLGKPPVFDGEDYCMWSNKMRHHLTSLHSSIWDIVEFGAHVPSVGDEAYDSDEVAQIRHFYSQATTILLASLCQEEYNKVQGLKSAKEIWDVLKTVHKGDEVTKITKRENIKRELGRFILNQGEEPQAMYNWLKTLVNQVRNLRSTKWDDHEMVKVIQRSLIFRNPTQVQLIRGDLRYKLMSPEEVIGKFVSFELMIKGSKQIIEQGGTSTPEVQPVAFKATEEKKEESTSSRLPIDASKLNNEEMALIIKSFHQILKQRRGKDYKTRSKKVCYKCGKPGHFIAKCPLSCDSDRGDDKKGRSKEKKKYYKKKGGDAHVCREWDSDESSTNSSSDEDTANIAITKGLLFPNVGHKYLMAKDNKKKKVKSRASTKYTTSSNEGRSSDDEDNLLVLFANLNMQQKEKLNELIGDIHEKDELLDSQEEFLIKENKKHVKVKNAYAQEVEKNENLSKELSICHDTISNLRTENAKLLAKVEKRNVCDDSFANLKNDNASLIAKIDKMNESLSCLKIENDLNVCNVSISNLRNDNAMLHAKIDELNACKQQMKILNLHLVLIMLLYVLDVETLMLMLSMITLL